jgi:hypothetical protein
MVCPESMPPKLTHSKAVAPDCRSGTAEVFSRENIISTARHFQGLAIRLLEVILILLEI